MVRFIGAIALVLSLAGYFSYLVNVKKISIFIAPSVIITSICTTIFPVNSCQMELHRVYYLCSCPFGGCELGDGGFFVRETPFPFFALPPVMREGLPLYALLPAMRERLPHLRSSTSDVQRISSWYPSREHLVDVFGIR